MSDSKPDMPSPQNREEALFQAAVQLTGVPASGDGGLGETLEAPGGTDKVQAVVPPCWPVAKVLPSGENW